jgi:hypothetical protein
MRGLGKKGKKGSPMSASIGVTQHRSGMDMPLQLTQMPILVGMLHITVPTGSADPGREMISWIQSMQRQWQIYRLLHYRLWTNTSLQMKSRSAMSVLFGRTPCPERAGPFPGAAGVYEVMRRAPNACR